MNPSTHKTWPRRAPESAILLLLLTVMASMASPWPQEPPAVPGTPSDPGFLFSAGLYQSLAEHSGLFPEPGIRMLRLRAFLAQGEWEAARDDAGEGLVPPRDLSLQLRLEDPQPWQDLQGDYWRRRLEGPDGESLYWRARLELTLGDEAAARAPLETLLRRHPGSVFASAAQELLAGLPDPGPGAFEAPAEAGESGFRVQWGVFREASRARRQVAVLEAYGGEARILVFERDGQPMHRVVSPSFAGREAARIEGERMKERYGLDFVIFTEEAAP